MSLSALRWHPCLHCAGDINSILLLSSPTLCQHHCLHCVGIFAFVELNLSPTLHPHCRKHCKLASAPSRCNCDTSAYVALSLCSLTSSVVFVTVTGAIPWQLGLHAWPILRWWFCWCCAGVITRVALAFLQALRCCLLLALRWHCHQCCIGLFALMRWHRPQHHKLASAQPRHSHDTSLCVASLSWSSSLPVASSPYLALFHGDLASDGLADAVLVSLLALCWRPWPDCAGVITNIALLLLPALRRHHCPCWMGAFALIALALLPSLPLRCRQHHKLVSAQSQSSRDTHWHPYQHHAVDIAGIVPTSLPLSRGHLCPCCTGVAALGTPVLLPA